MTLTEADLGEKKAEPAKVHACTCHPDDNPPVPCAQQYALRDCKAAAFDSERQQRIQAEQERDALREFVDPEGALALEELLFNPPTEKAEQT